MTIMSYGLRSVARVGLATLGRRHYSAVAIDRLVQAAKIGIRIVEIAGFVLLLFVLNVQRGLADQPQTYSGVLTDSDPDIHRALVNPSGCQTWAQATKYDVVLLEVSTEGDYEVSTCCGPTTDTVLYIYEGLDSNHTCSPAPLARDDDSCGSGRSKVITHLDPGSYQIVVSGFQSSVRGDYLLTVRSISGGQSPFGAHLGLIPPESFVIQPYEFTPGAFIQGVQYVHGLLKIPRLNNPSFNPSVSAAGFVALGKVPNGSDMGRVGWMVLRCGPDGRGCPNYDPECNMDAPGWDQTVCIMVLEPTANGAIVQDLVINPDINNAPDSLRPAINPATGALYRLGDVMAARLWMRVLSTGFLAGTTMFGGSVGGVSGSMVIWDSHPQLNIPSLMSVSDANFVGSGVRGENSSTRFPTHLHSWNAYSMAPQFPPAPDGIPTWSTIATWSQSYCWNTTLLGGSASDGIPYSVSPCLGPGSSWSISVR